MRKMILFLVAMQCVAMQNSMAQNSYYVLNVKGIVKIEKTKALLKTNDQISDQETLLFNSPSDAVAVIGSNSGRKILRPKPSGKASELICVVRDILNPGTGRLSARGGSITNVIELEHFFGRDSMHIFGQSKVWISPDAYLMDATNFFFVRYAWKGEVINKKLLSENDSLLINGHDIYKVDGVPISPKEVKEAKLYYKKGTVVSEIGPFAISFPEEQKVKEIVVAFKNHCSYTGKQFLDQLNLLLNDVYGRTDPHNVRNWVLKNVGSF